MSFAVLTQYTRSGAKASNHGWIAAAENIGMVSYVVVQLYEEMYGPRFTGVIRETEQFRTLAFAHLSSDCVLQRLSGKYELTEDRQLLTIAATDIGTVKTFGNPGVIKTVLRGVQALIKARRTAAKRNKEVESDQEDNI